MIRAQWIDAAIVVAILALTYALMTLCSHTGFYNLP